MEAQANGRQDHRRRPAALQHRGEGRLLAADLARDRAVPAAGHRPPAHRVRDVERRVRAALDQLGDLPAREAPGPTGRVGPGARGHARRVRRVHARGGRAEDRHRRRHDPRDRRADRRPPDQVRVAQLAGRRRRQHGRLAGGPLPVLPQRADRIGRHQGRHGRQRLEQVQARRSHRRARHHELERAGVAEASSRSPTTRCRSCCRTS